MGSAPPRLRSSIEESTPRFEPEATWLIGMFSSVMACYIVHVAVRNGYPSLVLRHALRPAATSANIDVPLSPKPHDKPGQEPESRYASDRFFFEKLPKEIMSRGHILYPDGSCGVPLTQAGGKKICFRIRVGFSSFRRLLGIRSFRKSLTTAWTLSRVFQVSSILLLS